MGCEGPVFTCLSVHGNRAQSCVTRGLCRAWWSGFYCAYSAHGTWALKHKSNQWHTTNSKGFPPFGFLKEWTLFIYFKTYRSSVSRIERRTLSMHCPDWPTPSQDLSCKTRFSSKHNYKINNKTHCFSFLRAKICDIFIS